MPFCCCLFESMHFSTQKRLPDDRILSSNISCSLKVVPFLWDQSLIFAFLPRPLQGESLPLVPWRCFTRCITLWALRLSYTEVCPGEESPLRAVKQWHFASILSTSLHKNKEKFAAVHHHGGLSSKKIKPFPLPTKAQLDRKCKSEKFSFYNTKGEEKSNRNCCQGRERFGELWQIALGSRLWAKWARDNGKSATGLKWTIWLLNKARKEPLF